MNGESLNLTEDLIAQLQAIVPAAFSEGKLDVEKLKTLIGEEAINKGERYELNWPGKADAYKVLQRPTTETLVPNPDDSVNWDETENVFIEGENLAVLKILQKSYYGKIKMIYIDPPYNTGSDSFIYPDKFSETKEEYAQRVGDKDDEGYMMKEGMFRKNSKDSGHYHSNWLNMMLPRLHLARNLLERDGLIFVSIDDNEQANLKLLMDQIFGEENFVESIIWKKRYGGGAKEKYLVSLHEYTLVYCRDISCLDKLYIPLDEASITRYYTNRDEKYGERGGYRTHPLEAMKSFDARENLNFPIAAPDGTDVWPKRQWRWGEERVNEALINDEIEFKKGKSGEWILSSKQYLKDEEGVVRKTKPFSIIDNVFTQHGTNEIYSLFGNAKVFSFPKPSLLLEQLITIGLNGDKESIILDFFSGSGATAQAILSLNEIDDGNRKFICVQLPEKTDENSDAYKAGYDKISAIAEARIKKVIEKIEKEREGQLPLEGRQILGFRKFTLQDSNFKVWRGDMEDVETLKQQMKLFVMPQREGALGENILWELLVKNGKLLTEKLIKHDVEGGIVWSIEDGSIAFVLEAWNPSVTDKLLELKPKKVIALDSVFEQDDAKKSNAQLQCEDAGITFTTV